MKPYEPLREIQFAAKSGFLSKALWNEFFAMSGGVSWRNKLWASFIKDGIFYPHYSKLAVGILVLNRKNSLVVKTVGEEVVSPPYVSQMVHDETLARIVLNLAKDHIITAYRLEPELKRLNPALQRHYASDHKDKYPDAIVQLANEKQTRIALELELTKKDPKRYRQIMDAYSSMKKVDRVVFIGRNERISQTIKQAMRDSYYPDLERPVGFGSLEGWTANPSTAKIWFAEETTSLARMTNPA